jgi:hypothetical protein
MPCIMEQFLWVWVTRMLQPLHGVGQPHKVTVFDWTQEHWDLVERQPDAAAAQAINEAKQAAEAEKAEQAAELLKAARRKEDKDIGTFEL